MCLNQYELIRKYQCRSCFEIMMCDCDEDYGTKYLPHQLTQGVWSESAERVSVTGGFQKKVCPLCRGEKAVAAPKAQMRGTTTKIARYYWREITFEVTERFYLAHPEIDPADLSVDQFSFPDECDQIRKSVIEDIKRRHKIMPKYQYTELSQQAVIDQANVEVILVNAEHVKTDTQKTGIVKGDKVITVEEFATQYFTEQGYKVLQLESLPFHVLFGVFMHPLIEDPDDEFSEFVFFGSRSDFDSAKVDMEKIGISLPSDFGTVGYYKRRKVQIDKHLNDLQDIKWLFSLWLDPSESFRQYLWAHREDDIVKAMMLILVLDVAGLQRILNYLCMDYWTNYCGWPDLFVLNAEECFFVEVKSRNDKLSEDQKNWFLGNHKHMGFKAKVFKVGGPKK